MPVNFHDEIMNILEFTLNYPFLRPSTGLRWRTIFPLTSKPCFRFRNCSQKNNDKPFQIPDKKFSSHITGMGGDNTIIITWKISHPLRLCNVLRHEVQYLLWGRHFRPDLIHICRECVTCYCEHGHQFWFRKVEYFRSDPRSRIPDGGCTVWVLDGFADWGTIYEENSFKLALIV